MERRCAEEPWPLDETGIGEELQARLRYGSLVQGPWDGIRAKTRSDFFCHLAASCQDNNKMSHHAAIHWIDVILAKKGGWRDDGRNQPLSETL